MAYETGTPSSVPDLIAKLSTFITGLSPAWTENEYDNTTNLRASYSKDNVYVSFRWHANDDALAIFGATGYAGSTAPEDQSDDDGQGLAGSGDITSGRRVNFEQAGPFLAYHFFASETAPYFVHVVVEVSSGIFRHFGFGNIANKKGSWTGGEYYYGHFWSQNNAMIDNAIGVSHGIPFDSMGTTASINATLHIEGYDDQGASDKWGVMFGSSSDTAGTDRGGNDRLTLRGGARGGFWPWYITWIEASVSNAYVPIAPVTVSRLKASTTPDIIQVLGSWPDVGVVNMKNLDPGQEIIVGGDTYMVFPWVRKQYNLADTEESWNAGFAYKKVA